MPNPPPIAVSMGEPAGIGGELSLAAWSRRKVDALPVFYVRDDASRLAELARRIGRDIPIQEIGNPADATTCFETALPVLHTPLPVPISPGQPDPANADAVTASIREGVQDVIEGRASAIVTQPIHKGVLMAAGFPHPGHTEFLGKLAGNRRSVMMLAAEGLRVVPVTVHIPLAEVPTRLTTDLIVETGRIVARDLGRYFGLSAPRLAVSGLNPHAGEDGALGSEEKAVIDPAVAELRRLGINALGPHPGDTMFHAEARADYDVALCMYHDQALIPLKTLDFHGGVNITLGLGFIRTSPDHGTAFALAGTGRANPASFIASLRQAARMAETSAANA